MGRVIMGAPATEREWFDKATTAAVAGARRIAAGIKGKQVGELEDREWGWIVAAVIVGWIEIRMQQAIAEGRDAEEVVRWTDFVPDPCDVAVVHSILSALADKAGIDWSRPLAAWSKDTMTDFLMLAWRLIGEAETVRDHGPGTILKKSEFNEKVGDPIPF
jgi:hypothetical protein